MRKLSALFVLIIVFIPLAFAAMTLTAIRPWVLDRGFYEGIVNDERLYEVLLTNDLPRRFNRDAFTEVEQLPLDALSVALREVLTAEYLRAQSLNVIDQVFEYFEGRARNFEWSWDITPIKVVLAGDARIRFATTLAANLPDCADGQQPVAPEGSLTRCITAGSSSGAAAEQIAEALPSVLESTPDSIVLNDSMPYIRMNWYDIGFLPGSSVVAALDIALLTTIVTALAVGFVGAYLGGDDLRSRLKWFSASLFFPSTLFLAAGLFLISPYIAGAISRSMNLLGYNEAYRDAALDVMTQIIQQMGNGLLLTGLVASVIAFGLLILSWATPASDPQKIKMVQVPARTL